jgi:hypothetical protein
MIFPSIYLLFGKIIGVFFLSWIAGWSVCWRRPAESNWVSWLILLVVGAVVLNLTVTTAIVLGLPGYYGLLGLLIICFIKIICTFNVSRVHWPKNIKEFLLPVTLICGLVVFSYCAPFISQNSSGIYSRGGGDHSTYLALSEYFQYKSLWDKVEKSETIPPSPYWESKTYPHSQQNIFSKIHVVDTNSALPLGNQMIASAYMAVLPGEADETYSAVVAFYSAIAAGAVVAFLYTILGGWWSGVAWLAFVPVGLSSLLLYPSGTQSIPFLFAIGILNISFLLAWQLTRVSIDIRHSTLYVPAIICGGGLLTIYPFLFIVLVLFYGVFSIINFSPDRLKNYFHLGLIVSIGSLVLTHFYLLINIPLVFFGATGGNSLYHRFTFLQILSTQSGLIDFLMLPNGGVLSIQAKASIAVVVVIMALSVFGFIKRKSRELVLFIVVMCVFSAGALYYNLKDAGGSYGYQMVRFATLSHLYLLSLAGLGLAVLLKGTRWQFSLGLALIAAFASFAINQRIAVVRDIVSVPHAFATEFRDADAFRIRAEMLKLQKTAAEAGRSRMVYYYGHGDGTDFAGSTVFMRPLYALNAFNLQSVLQNSRGKVLWDEGWLEGALLIYSPVYQRDVIKDKRQQSAVMPLLSSERMSVWDTASQNIAAVMGESWNYPIPYDVDAEPHSFRYLRGQTGALVIWSDREELVKLSVKGAADAAGARLHFRDVKNQTEKAVPFNFWGGNYHDPLQTTVFLTEVKLLPGPNVFELTPKNEAGSPPWLLIFEINIGNSTSYVK